jgi:hypothetical protein
MHTKLRAQWQKMCVCLLDAPRAAHEINLEKTLGALDVPHAAKNETFAFLGDVCDVF